MQHADYILSNAGLPFDLGSLDPEADILFGAVPNSLRDELNNADLHSDVIHAGDKIALWIENNWRRFLPELSARFPEKMWEPPTGWFKAACEARDARSTEAARIKDNRRRQQYGLPTYEV